MALKRPATCIARIGHACAGLARLLPVLLFSMLQGVAPFLHVHVADGPNNGSGLHLAGLSLPGTPVDVALPDPSPETEAIELLLQTRRANPRSGGGGGGSSPGGGGSGSTDQAALEHFGPDADAAAVVQERGVQQTTGNTSEDIPTEYREGIDAFFNAIDGR